MNNRLYIIIVIILIILTFSIGLFLNNKNKISNNKVQINDIGISSEKGISSGTKPINSVQKINNNFSNKIGAN